jgi:ABC-2 type transport system ATP-binding protein
MAAIETFALEKSYGVGFWRKKTKVALRPLTLSVPEREIFGYLGPNGAGKTTTLRLIMGLVAPTSGSFKLLSGEISDPQVRSQVGFLPEQPYFYDHLTPRELLDYFATLSGISAKGRSRHIEATLTRVGLKDDAWNTQLRKFSKGMLQRVGLAQAILHNPSLIILDEPMSGLDPMGRREVRDLIEELNHEGKTIFFSTHILSDAEALCDRVAVLDRGELRGVGVVADLTSSIKGKVEITWSGESACPAVEALGVKCHVVADTARAVILESEVDRVIDIIRNQHLRLIAVTPMRTTLEDYFMAKLGAPAEVSR